MSVLFYEDPEAEEDVFDNFIKPIDMNDTEQMMMMNKTNSTNATEKASIRAAF